MTEQKERKVINLGAVSAFLAVAICAGLSHCSKPAPTDTEEQAESSDESSAVEVLLDDSGVRPIEAIEVEEVPQMGDGEKFEDPADLVAQVMKRMSQVESERDIQDLATILGNGKADAQQIALLKKLYGNKKLKLRDENAVELIGEIRAGKVSRWVIHLQDSSKIFLQTAKQKDGSWKIEQVRHLSLNADENGNPLAEKGAQTQDSLMFSHDFLKALASQNFEKARSMSNGDNISDAKIAGMCILFEDGAYALNQQKPLQAVRMTDKMGVFYVNVKANDGSDAQFSVNSSREAIGSSWQINEINLDRLLEDYAKRIAGGDVYYTPLIKNPNGGEMLVIYFEFDSNGLTDRTKKQLDIVANLLRLDDSKKVRLSGHTDSKGSDTYNQGLSKERAVSVREYLGTQGIKAAQIVIEAHGFNKPMRPDTKADGSDDPNGRRVNRRTEIYLDF